MKIEEFTEKLIEELATMKIMIYSLYKSITLDEDLKNVSKWEEECKAIAKKELEANNE